jgi:hypothetical protein
VANAFSLARKDLRRRAIGPTAARLLPCAV